METIGLFNETYEVLPPFEHWALVDLTSYAIDEKKQLYITMNCYTDDKNGLILVLCKVNKKTGYFNRFKQINKPARDIKPLRLLYL